MDQRSRGLDSSSSPGNKSYVLRTTAVSSPSVPRGCRRTFDCSAGHNTHPYITVLIDSPTSDDSPPPHRIISSPSSPERDEQSWRRVDGALDSSCIPSHKIVSRCLTDSGVHHCRTALSSTAAAYNCNSQRWSSSNYSLDADTQCHKRRVISSYSLDVDTHQHRTNISASAMVTSAPQKTVPSGLMQTDVARSSSRVLISAGNSDGVNSGAMNKGVVTRKVERYTLTLVVVVFVFVICELPDLLLRVWVALHTYEYQSSSFFSSFF